MVFRGIVVFLTHGISTFDLSFLFSNWQPFVYAVFFPLLYWGVKDIHAFALPISLMLVHIVVTPGFVFGALSFLAADLRRFFSVQQCAFCDLVEEKP
jgi:hypothetical protein